MKSYTPSELSRIIEDIKDKNNILQETVDKLKESRKTIKLLDFKSKDSIEQKIKGLNGQITCNNYAIMMLCLYEDSLRTDYSSMSEEKLIRCEMEAESGDGMSKLIVFCHKCFIEHTIVQRDIKRLEIEAEEGVLSSSYILYAYNSYFAD